MGVGPARLHRDDRLHVAGGGGVHLGEDEAMGAATAELGFILSLDYAEGVEDVAGVGPRRAIETKSSIAEQLSQGRFCQVLLSRVSLRNSSRMTRRNVPSKSSRSFVCRKVSLIRV